MDTIVDAVAQFRAERIRLPDGRDGISNGFSIERLDLTGIPYMSRSRISKLKQSPAHYEWRYIKGNEDKDTPQKSVGGCSTGLY